MAAESEPGSEREANDPVGCEVTEHGCAGVAGTAECACGYGLNAIKELEGGTRSEKRGGVANDVHVGGVDASDPLRNGEQDDACEGHKGCADEYGGAARDGGSARILSTEGLANANCGGGSDAERDHVGEGDGIERDLVRGERDGPQASDERRDGGEDSAFERELHRGGNAERDEAANAREVHIDRSFEKFRAVLVVVPEKIADEDRSHVDAGDGGGPAGADGAHGGKAEFAVDEKPVEDGVDDVGGDERERDGADHVHGLQAAAHGEVEEQGKEPPNESFGVGNGLRSDGRVDTPAQEERREKPDGRRQQRRESDTEIDTVHERAMAIFALAGAEGLRDKRVQSEKKAFAKKGQDHEDGGAKTDGAHGYGGVGQASDHHGVDDGHAHPAEFGKDQRESEAERRADFRCVGL